LRFSGFSILRRMQMKRFASLTTYIRVRAVFQAVRLRVRLREYWSAMKSAGGREEKRIKVRKKNGKRILTVFSENQRRKRDRGPCSECVFRSLQTIACNGDGGACLIYPTRDRVATDSLRSQRREKLGRCIDSPDASPESHVLVSRVRGIAMHWRRTDEPPFEGRALISSLSTGISSSNSSSNSDTYRRRRDSYSAAMINEKPTADESSESSRRADTSVKCQQLVVQKVSKLPDNCSLESECWSTESSVLKRELARTPSTDTSRSWNESIEMPEMFTSHPELWGRLARCRCFLAAKLSISSDCQCQCRCQCRCSQCQYHRRKFSSCSSRDHTFLQSSFKRKDSSYSVSTCQSILPPSSGRNSVVSLCHEMKEEGRLETRLVGEVIQRRHSDQTQSPRGCKIGRADNRRFSEQTLARSSIERVRRNSGSGCDEPVATNRPIVTRTCPRFFPEKAAGISQSWSRLRNQSRETDPLKETSPQRNIDVGSVTSGQKKRKKDECLRDAASNERRRSSASITPKMMRRRFSEQLILEGGLGSIPDYEDLLQQPEEGDESLTAANARKKITLKRHYYPEGGWGRVIALVAILVQLICHGLQLGSGVLLSSTLRQFRRSVEHA
ncbi:unnamed protein product, partial [Heterotrigona itama]